MKPCVSAATTMATPFAEDVRAYAEGGCTALEVWLTKLEEHLKQHSPAGTKELLAEHGMTLAAASYQGGLLLSQRDERRTHHDHFQRRLSICQEFQIPTLVLAPDVVSQVTPGDLQRAVESLQQAGQVASAYGVRLALEFRARSNWCASLATAVQLVEACGLPEVGVALDVFHYYTGPSKFEDLRLLNRANLALVQVCDLAGAPREFAGDADRVLPGDGDFELAPILEHLKNIGYDGWISVELMNPEVWKMKPASVAHAALAAIQRLLPDGSEKRKPPAMR